ncbi:MAG: phosphomannomutase, partial [Paracoccaceae bacterium]
FAATRGGQSLSPLFSRDACLPMIAVLAEAVARRMPVSALLADLPDIATATGRLQNIPASRSKAAIEALRRDPARRRQLFQGFGAELAGGAAATVPDNVLCCRFEGERQVILRPSGNAPELRAYVEASSAARPAALLDVLLERLTAQLS